MNAETPLTEVEVFARVRELLVDLLDNANAAFDGSATGEAFDTTLATIYAVLTEAEAVVSQQLQVPWRASYMSMRGERDQCAKDWQTAVRGLHDAEAELRTLRAEKEKLTERLAAAEAQLSEARRQYRPEYGKAPLEAKQPPGSRIPALVTKLKNRNRMIIANNCWGDRHGLNHAYEVRTIIELMESELARTGAALPDPPVAGSAEKEQG